MRRASQLRLFICFDDTRHIRHSCFFLTDPCPWRSPSPWKLLVHVRELVFGNQGCPLTYNDQVRGLLINYAFLSALMIQGALGVVVFCLQTLDPGGPPAPRNSWSMLGKLFWAIRAARQHTRTKYEARFSITPCYLL